MTSTVRSKNDPLFGASGTRVHAIGVPSIIHATPPTQVPATRHPRSLGLSNSLARGYRSWSTGPAARVLGQHRRYRIGGHARGFQPDQKTGTPRDRASGAKWLISSGRQTPCTVADVTRRVPATLYRGTPGYLEGLHGSPGFWSFLPGFLPGARRCPRRNRLPKETLVLLPLLLGLTP